MGWMENVRTAVYKALCATFGVDPALTTSAARFIPAYVENATNPQAMRNANVCYYAISEERSEGTDYVQISYKKPSTQGKAVLTRTIPISVLLTFYGPNADNDAETFWSMFQWDSGAVSPRAVLRGEKIVPIGKPDMPVSLFEVEGTYHRRRCDVRLRLAYLYVTEHDASLVEQPPEITTVVNN